MGTNYVYFLFDWRGIPRYVGKGKGRRDGDHERSSNASNRLKAEFIKQTWIMLGEIPKIRIRENLVEPEAFKIEVALIAAIGRMDLGTGPLTNMTAGGEGISGRSAESRAKTSAQARRQNADPNHPMVLNRNTPTAIERRIAGIRASRSSPEYLERISKARKDAWVICPQFWWTDGVLEKRLSVSNAPPDGWYRGRCQAVKNKFSRTKRRLYQDPKERAKRSHSQKLRMANPANRELLRISALHQFSDDGAKARHASLMKRIMADPVIRSKVSEARKGKRLNDAQRAAHSEAIKAMWVRRKAQAAIRLSEIVDDLMGD